MVPPGSAADAIDRARLAKMGNEVGEQAMRHYLALFCGLLGERVERIAGAAAGSAGGSAGEHAEVTEDALRAALDLHVSSAMLGADRLATTAADVAVLLRSGEPIGSARMRALRSEAEAAYGALLEILAALGGPGPGPASDSGH